MADTPALDAFAAFEQSGWRTCADPYQRFFGELTTQTVDALLASVAAPDVAAASLLDLATGPGYVAKGAVRAGFGRVVGVDFSEPMLELARAEPAGVDFQRGDAQALVFADALFDAVTLNFGLLHLSTPERSLSEAFRVLKPGGKIGFTVWSLPEHCPGLALINGAIAAHADLSVPLPEGPPFFYYSARDNSIAALRTAGFSAPRVQRLALVWSHRAARDFFDAFLLGTARTGGLLRLQSEQTLLAIEQAVTRDLQTYWDGALFRVPMSAELAVAQKP